MGLTINNNSYTIGYSNTIKKSPIKAQEESPESVIEQSGYNPNGVIIFDRKNMTAYFDGIKMDEKFMNIMSMPGYHYKELMSLKKTDESILEKIIES